MKILIYNWKDLRNPTVGGAEIITAEFARRLVLDGHQVTWFCRSFAKAKPTETIDGISIVRQGNLLTTYWYGYRYYHNLETKPDLVIDMLNTIAWQTPLYARDSRVVQYVNQLAKEVFDYNLRPPFSWIGKLVESFQLIPYHHRSVVTYAGSTADDLVAWGYDRSKIEQFRLGLDHERYQPGKKADYPLFLQVCRMVGMKRPDLTVKAFAEVIKKYPEAKLALVGTGPFKPTLDQLIKRLGIKANILMPEKDIWFLRKHQSDQKVQLMQAAWAFVHPSVKEGWGMVLTEAAACGTPSIATAVTGQVDAVKPNQTGILISPNPTVDELAEAMLKLIEDEPFRHRLEKNCLSWAAEFNWDKSYDLFKTALTKATGLSFVRPPARPAEQLPDITIITPVYNAAKVLEQYFAGISQTTYPKDKLHFILPDGGSSDRTRPIAEKHRAKVIENRLKTAEAGKAEGVKYLLAELKKKKRDLTNQLICLLDSDNIIVDPDWFNRMVEPLLVDRQIIGSEPWQYLRRDKDGYITRYTAMIGMSDPVVNWLGNYDRLNLLTGRWTDLSIKTVDRGDYLVWDVDAKVLPTIGANGTLFRASFFDTIELGDFLFDIDVLYEYTENHKAKFAKVKLGIVHLFSGSVKTFIRKQRRRVKDHAYFQAMGLRKYPWDSLNKKGLALYILSCLTILPLFWQVIKGYRRKPDRAWFFHPVACWITLWVYGTGRIMAKFQKPALADRTNWSQG